MIESGSRKVKDTNFIASFFACTRYLRSSVIGWLSAFYVVTCGFAGCGLERNHRPAGRTGSAVVCRGGYRVGDHGVSGLVA